MKRAVIDSKVTLCMLAFAACGRACTGGFEADGGRDSGGDGAMIVQAISAGHHHTCAVVSGGARCWGWNRQGRLGGGAGRSGSTPFQPTPVQVVGLTSGVTSISAGIAQSDGRDDARTCAIVNGAARCWGVNDFGQLGDGTTTERGTPVQVAGLTSRVTSISSGGTHTCAIVNGGARCWAVNDYGQLGDGSITNTDRGAPVQVVGLTSGVTSISAGGAHACAIVAGGARCWGSNSFGKLGDGTSANRNTPVQVVGLTSGVTSISAGSYHACAIVDGGARCWGNNEDGELGDGTSASRNTPVQVVGLTSGVTGIAVGAMHTCAIVNGGARCWGNNNLGELGDGTVTNRSTPVQVVGLAAGVTSITAGHYDTCAIVNGGARCWGSNGYGQLGDGTTTERRTPVAVAFPTP